MNQNKYYLLSIVTYCGEFEFRSVITKTSTESDQEVADEVLMNWYGEDAFEGFDGGIATYINGLTAECQSCEKITEAEYLTFQKYSI